MNKIILINARHPEEKRVAIADGKRLIDFYVEVPASEHLKGNIYKGVVTSLEQGLQAAFVDFGHKKHGFLSVRDVMPEHYLSKTKSRNPKVNEVLARGQELVVQVERDRRDNKGASLTTGISLPGRYLVLMPGREHVGVSRKIEDQDVRERMKEAFRSLKISKKTGFILRTAGADRSTEELSNDLNYLTRLWNKIRREAGKAKAPSLIYKEVDIAVRTVRDYLTEDVTEVLVDDREAFQSIKAFLKRTMPWRSINVTHYRQKEPLFEQYGLEEQIARLNDRQATLPSKGFLAIDKTEALTAIDVNSGRSRKAKGMEALALRTNLEAADEVARQLRLRDIGGLIVVDFIDMESDKNNRKVEDLLRKALSLDKAHYDISRISKFGLLEMTRERMRTAYYEATSSKCPTCLGAGVLKAPDLVAVSALREIHARLSKGDGKGITCRLPVESANYLVNELRDGLTAIEKEFSVRVTVIADTSAAPGTVTFDKAGATIKDKAAPGERRPKRARRRRKGPANEEEVETPAEKDAGQGPEEGKAAAQEKDQSTETGQEKPKRTRRRRRRPPKKVEGETSKAQSAGQGPEEGKAAAQEKDQSTETGQEKPKRTRRRKRPRSRRKPASADNSAAHQPSAEEGQPREQPENQ